MIQINLLQETGRKASSRKKSGAAAVRRPGGGGPSPLFLLTLVAALLLNGLAGYYYYNQISAARIEYEDAKASRDKYKREIEQNLSKAEEVRKFREVVENQMDVLRTLDPPERILWCEKLNMISNLMPPNVFLSDLEVTEQVEMVETEESRAAHAAWEKTPPEKRGKEPAIVKKPILNYVLRLTGLALGADNVEQMNNIMKLHNALMTHEAKDPMGQRRRFMDGFQETIEFGTIEATNHEGEPVNRFQLTLISHKMGGAAPKAGPKPEAATQIAAAKDEK